MASFTYISFTAVLRLRLTAANPEIEVIKKIVFSRLFVHGCFTAV